MPGYFYIDLYKPAQVYASKNKKLVIHNLQDSQGFATLRLFSYGVMTGQKRFVHTGNIVLSTSGNSAP
jgi:hypothetical protein